MGRTHCCETAHARVGTASDRDQARVAGPAATRACGRDCEHEHADDQAGGTPTSPGQYGSASSRDELMGPAVLVPQISPALLKWKSSSTLRPNPAWAVTLRTGRVTPPPIVALVAFSVVHVVPAAW